MKKIVILLCFTHLSAGKLFSQVHFEQLSWQQALGKARDENKMMFIEVYTTWCTYCRQMDATVFSQPQVGNYQNEHFINLKFDALKADGITIRKSYAVLAIPSFLYLDPGGMLVKKVIGYQSEEQLLQISQTALAQFVKHAGDTLAKK